MRMLLSFLLPCALMLNAMCALAQTDSAAAFQVKSPFEDLANGVECPVDASRLTLNLTPVFEAMMQGPKEAAACARALDASRPDWHREDGADVLVAPFLRYLLGDGVARGMQRHDDFINLLGHLQKIAPNWRLRDEMDAILEEALIESVAQDPFVADFWRQAVEEGHLGWRESEEAKAVMPVIYALAVIQQQRTDGLINKRPKMLLKELSWLQYAKLIFETRLWDSWLKRALWILLLLFIVGVIRLKLRA